jgi:hypothetical protein
MKVDSAGKSTGLRICNIKLWRKARKEQDQAQVVRRSEATPISYQRIQAAARQEMFVSISRSSVNASSKTKCDPSRQGGVIGAGPQHSGHKAMGKVTLQQIGSTSPHCSWSTRRHASTYGGVFEESS